MCGAPLEGRVVVENETRQVKSRNQSDIKIKIDATNKLPKQKVKYFYSKMSLVSHAAGENNLQIFKGVLYNFYEVHNGN